MTVIECEVYWAKVLPPTVDGKFAIDMCNLTDGQAKLFTALKVPVREEPEKKPEQGKFVSAKSNYEPKVFGPNKEAWNPAVKIGNGSVCRVSWDPYSWKFEGKKGWSAGLVAVVVMKHVPYVASLDPEESLSDGAELFEGLDSEADVNPEGTPFDDPIADLLPGDDEAEDLSSVA